MTITTPLRLRTLEPRDLSAVNAVLRAAFKLDTSFLPRLKHYVAVASDGWVVAERSDDIVGVGFLATFGPCAYIGLMGVSPAAQSAGVGAAIFEEILARAEARSIRLLLLDASAAGAPLYPRYGFVDRGEAIAYVIDQRPRAESATGERERVAVQPLAATTKATLDALLALDTAAYGADRARLVSLYATADLERTLVAFDDRGEVAGYAIAQARAVGPVVASEPAIAEALIRRSLRLPFDAPRVTVLVPGQSAASIELLARLGAARDRTLRHMRRGDDSALASDWSRLYAKGSFAVG